VAALLEKGDVQFVRSAYWTLLGRQVDDNGLANYLTQLRAGADKADILVALALSLEGKRRQIQVPGMEALFTASQQREPSRWIRFLRRLATPLHAPTESLERGWRIVDNHLHRLEATLADQAREIYMLRSDLQSMHARLASQAPDTAVATMTAAALTAPVDRLVPPRAQQLLGSLRRTRALRLRAR